jgi:hypothetical protein
MHDSQSHEWVFPAASRSGHVEEIKGTSWVDGKNGDKRKIVRLSKVGHSLRHSYRTLCAAAGLDRRRTKLLMNHQVSRDVTDAYLSTPALFDQLREAQRTVSNLIARSASQDPDERLTRLLLSEVRGGAVSTMVSHAHSAISRSQARPIESKGGASRHQSFNAITGAFLPLQHHLVANDHARTNGPPIDKAMNIGVQWIQRLSIDHSATSIPKA